MFPNGAGNPVAPDSLLRRRILPALEVCGICSKPEGEQGKVNTSTNAILCFLVGTAGMLFAAGLQRT